MTKPATATTRPATHFEQVPVEEVKRLVRQDPGTSETAAAGADTGHFHGVQFYDHPDALCRIVGTFLGEGLEQGAVAVVIATRDHTAKIEHCLRDRGLDVDVLKQSGAIVMHDARTTLDQLMGDGMPDPAVFRRTIGGILEEARRSTKRVAIRAYGEMVDLLWKEGLEAAAIRLETQWNQLAGTHPFGLLCGYSMGNFYKGAALDRITRQHSHVGTPDAVLRRRAQAAL